MLEGSLARRYAKAVFELGRSGGNLDKIGTNLRTLAHAMRDSAELLTVLTNPAIRRNDRRRVIDGLLQRVAAEPQSKNLVYLLLDGERLSHLAPISRELDQMIQSTSGHIGAEIVSAKPLDSAQLGQITLALEQLSGKKVDVTKREDAALLGGVIAKVGDVVYDGSLRTQLRTLREELTK